MYVSAMFQDSDALPCQGDSQEMIVVERLFWKISLNVPYQAVFRKMQYKKIGHRASKKKK